MTPTQVRPGPGRAAVADVSVLVLADPQGSPLDDLLAALAAQDVPAQRVLVCGLDPHGQEAEQALAHPGLQARRIPVLLRPAPARDGAETPRWQVVEDARGSLPVHEDNWIWVLQDDSLPEPGALAALTLAVRRSSRVGLVGPKLVRADDPRLLVGVGHQVTVAGRAGDPRQAPLVDQGQLDQRQDVLSVPLVGSLVRSDLLAEVGGLDQAFGEDGVEGLDLGWRLHLAGHRVVVAPDAVVHQGEAGLGVVDPRRTRVRTRQLALARGSFLASIPRALGVIVTSTLAALLLLLVKRPTEAADEWADVRAALAPWRGWGARWRFRGRRRVRPRDLRGLFLTPGTGWRATTDTVGAALDPRARSARQGTERERRPGSGSAETGPVSDELVELGPAAGRIRRWSWPLATVLLASLVLMLWHLRSLLGALRPGGTGVAGGELGPAAARSGDLWRSALDPWRGGGLGHDGPAEAWLVPASALARIVEVLPGAGQHTVGVALGWVLLLAVPASVLTGYLGLRRATRRGWVRAGLALGYAGLLPLTSAIAEGRVGPVVVHVLAPLLVAGYAVCSAREGGSRRAAAAFATALAATLAVQWVPAVLVLSSLGGLALLFLGRGQARWRGFVITVLPWALMLPWLPNLATDPTRLLGGAGASLVGADRVDAPAWGMALLQPAGPYDLSGVAGPGLDPWDVVALVAVGLLWLAGLAAVALAGRSGRRAAILVATAVVSLGLAILGERLVVGVLPAGHELAGQGVSPWPGTFLSVTGAALVLAAALLLERLLALVDRYRTTTTQEAPRWAGALIVTAAVLGVTLPSLAAASTAWQAATTEPARLTAAGEQLPAVAAEQGRGPSAVRTLVLEPLAEAGAGAVDAGSLDGAATDGGATDAGADPAPGLGEVSADLVGVEPEPARILRDRIHDLAAPRAGVEPVEDVVLAITGARTGQEALTHLQELGVGFVLVDGVDDGPVVTQIDRVPQLTRVSSPPGQVLWRLAGQQGARVQVLDADGAAVGRVDVTGPHAAAESVLPQDLRGTATTVRAAEGEGWARQALATVDGQPVEVAQDGTIALPEGASEVTLSQRSPAFALHLVAAVLALIAIFLALPFGRVEPEEAGR